MNSPRDPDSPSKSIALYAHLPWCQKKCPYCDFNSHKAPEALPQARYIDALIKDLGAEVRRFDRCGVDVRSISSVFIGGGTPSLFDPDSIATFLQSADSLIPLSDGCEVTMEANPGALEVGRLPGYRRAGINRLSLGVQSLNDQHLKTIGREHDSEQARVAIERALCSGLERVNVDLMYGLPQQSIAEVLEDLTLVERYGIKHLSWYELTIEPNTAFGWRPPAGLPDENLSLEMRLRGREYLSSVDMEGYEISAYGRSTADRCRHNLNYWNFGDYIGIGAGAHGKLTLPETGQIVRGHKARSPLTYMKRCLDIPTVPNEDLTTTPAMEFHELVQPESVADEFLINALRLADGFSLNLWRERTNIDEGVLKQAAAGLVGDGKLSIKDGRMSLTRNAAALLDEVIAQLCHQVAAVRGF